MSKLAAKIRKQFFGLLLLFAAALLVVAGAGVWGLGQIQISANKLYSDHLQTAQITADVSQDLDDAYETAQGLLLVDSAAERTQLTNRFFSSDVPAAEVALQELERLHAGDPPSERALVQALAEGWERFRGLWSADSLLAATPNAVVVDKDLRAVFDLIEPLTDHLQQIEQRDAQAARQRGDDAYRTSLILIGVVTAAGLLSGVALVVFVTRRLIPRSIAPEQAHAAFVEAMQLAANEAEAQTLLKRHLERTAPGATIVLLSRGAHSDSLEAACELTADSTLRDTLSGATTRSCVAIRTARPHHTSAAQEDLQPCQVCGSGPGVSLCTPLTVGGDVIGSVLVTQSQALDSDGERTVHDSITQAAPVLANLRNLSTAKSQAATDTLTGLPNKRSAISTLKRMVAHAGRSLTPLAALSIDLDHFKAINDRHGHGRGDEVLAAVGVALESVLRASDFAARTGGEEFLVLLPETALGPAVTCAERIQAALRQIPVLDGEKPVTASIGIAILPDHAHDATSLELAADRELYMAKRNGRDRVEVADGANESLPGPLEAPLDATMPV